MNYVVEEYLLPYEYYILCDMLTLIALCMWHIYGITLPY